MSTSKELEKSHSGGSDDASRVYVVLGGTGGIGSRVASLLRGAGHEVVVSGRDQAKLERLESNLGVIPFTHSRSGCEDIDSCISATVERFGRLDGAVNCLGSVLLKPAHRTSDEEWSSTIEMNLTTSFRLIRAAVSAMLKSGGSIVLISSAAGLTGMPNHEAIAAAKAGVIGLCKSAAASYARRAIRINSIAPGLVQTTMTRDLIASEENRHASECMHPMGRLGTPEDIAEAVVWLLSSKSSWITGQVLSVDGGLANLKPQNRR
ncbi:MAG: SDR family oxidoreductase [Candidatus Obscuribacterales bacterium]|nr:SDR family oxidoreductase [Candidatus Obscuribacterales bacterium]